MAQILFRDLMNSYRVPGNDNENRESFGKYADSREYAHCYDVRYTENGFSNSQFLDWIIQYMSGAVMIAGNRIWFNSDADETTLILTFDGKTSYGDKILWKWHKNPNTKSFEAYLPYDGVWSR